MSDDASSFDPRFDPAFQRGYDGPTPTSSPARSSRRSRSDSPPQPIGLPPQYSAVEQPVVSQRPSEFLQPSPADRRAEDRRAEDRAALLELEAEDAPRGPNPFLLALLACGALLVISGIALLSQFQSIMDSQPQNGFPQSVYYFMQVVTYGAPLLICLGLATLIGVLFIYAVRWRRSA